jgi:hypothetical protein
MNPTLRFTVGSLALATSVSAIPQNQSVDQRSRSAGVELHSYAAATPGWARLHARLHGPENAPFTVLFDFPATIPAHAAYGFTVPPFFLAPLALDLANPALVLVNLNFGPTGLLDVPLGPIPIGRSVGIQTIALDAQAPGVVQVSNGIRRLTSAPAVDWNVITTAPWSPIEAEPGSYVEVEQGDVDGDGDTETLLIKCGGALTLFTNPNAADQGDPGTLLFQEFNTPSSTMYAAEMADFDQDGYYDVAVACDTFLTGAVALRVFMNNGRAPVGGANQLGPWLGFTELPQTSIQFDTSVFQAIASLDLETGDVDGDGDIDIALACVGANPAVGAPSRLMLNAVDPAGGGLIFTDASFTNLHPVPPILADSEDIEIADIDADGDLDILTAGYGVGNTASSFEWVFVNQGGRQGGVEGMYAAQTLPGAPMDRSYDVLVQDLDLDGLPEIYVGNHKDVTGSLPVRDVLYVNTTLPTGAVVSFAPTMGTMHDAANPRPTTDVEYVNLSGDPANPIVGLVLSAGTKCTDFFPNSVNFGIRVVRVVGPGVQMSTVDVTATELNDSGVFTGINIKELELGDWRGRVQAFDLGVASTPLFSVAGFQALFR